MAGIGIGQTTRVQERQYQSTLQGAKGADLSRNVARMRETATRTRDLGKDIQGIMSLGMDVYKQEMKLSAEATRMTATDMLVDYQENQLSILGSTELTNAEKRDALYEVHANYHEIANKELDLDDEQTRLIFDRSFTDKQEVMAKTALGKLDLQIKDEELNVQIDDSNYKMKTIPDHYSISDALKDQAEAIRFGYTSKEQVSLDVISAKDKYLNTLAKSNSSLDRDRALAPETIHSQFPEYTSLDKDGKLIFKKDAPKGIVAAISAGIRSREVTVDTINDNNQKEYDNQAVDGYQQRIIDSLGNSAETLNVYSDIKNDKNLSSSTKIALLDKTDTRIKTAKLEEVTERKSELFNNRNTIISKIGELQVRLQDAKEDTEKTVLEGEIKALIQEEAKNRTEIISLESPGERAARLAETKRIKNVYKNNIERITTAPIFDKTPETMIQYQGIINGTYRSQMAPKVAQLKTNIQNIDPLYMSMDEKLIMLNKIDKSFDTLQVNAVKSIAENIKGYDTKTLISEFQRDEIFRRLVNNNKEVIIARGSVNKTQEARLTTSLAFARVNPDKLATLTLENWQNINVLLDGGFSYTELQNMKLDKDLDIYKNIDNLEDAEAAKRIAQVLTYAGVDSSEGYFTESEVGKIISDTYQAKELDMPGWDRFNTVSKVSVKSSAFNDVYNQTKLHRFLEYKDKDGRTLFGGMLSNDIGDNIDDNGVFITQNQDGTHNVNIKGSAGFQDTLVTFKEIDGVYYPTYMNSKFYNEEDIRNYTREK